MTLSLDGERTGEKWSKVSQYVATELGSNTHYCTTYAVRHEAESLWSATTIISDTMTVIASIPKNTGFVQYLE